ncbi:MAG TPA: glycosyltransferase family 39 protein [Terriglobales bacterium]|nr:glycosyltransferase family 39 protein [Terriglobales bacterium]
MHAPLLRLPYFWDEAGYYVPAARDLLLSGSLIPPSTAANAHPPLVLAWLALWWKLSGYTPAVTRTAMLLVAAFALLGVFRLARNVANLPVAVAVTAATALYPVFFAQSSMAHTDVAAAALSLWGIVFLVEHRRPWSILLFCLAVLAKETAVVAPVAIGLWELWWWARRRRGRKSRFAPPPTRLIASCALALAPIVMLAAWYAYHYARTGYVFGNPEFHHYKGGALLDPLRTVRALAKRLWQITGYMNLFLLTAAAAMAMAFPPQPEALSDAPRERISLDVQAVFAVVIAAQVVLYSLAGDAPLARCLLTSLPLVVIVCVSTIWRRMRQWPLIMGIVCAGFVLAWFVNPPYPFALEDNLAYRDYVLLHRRAASLVAAHHARERVLTAWPATDELSRPYLGYTSVAVPVVPLEDFSAPRLLAAGRDPSQFDLALLFSTEYQPGQVFGGFPLWQRRRHNLPPEIAAQILGGRVIFRESRNGQWVALIAIERAENAGMAPQQLAVGN